MDGRKEKIDRSKDGWMKMRRTDRWVQTGLCAYSILTYAHPLQTEHVLQTKTNRNQELPTARGEAGRAPPAVAPRSPVRS